MAPRQQQGTRCALAEPGGEQRRAAHLRGHQWFDLIRLEDEDLRTRGRVIGVGQAHHDAVVGGRRFLVDAVALEQSPAHDQCQGSIDPQAVWRVQDHPPVAQFVAESFDDERGVTGYHGGRRTLIGE